MSVEWSVRLAADVAMARLVARSEQMVSDVLVTAPGELELVARGLDGSEVGVVGDVSLVDGFACLIGLADGVNATGVNVIDVGYPDDAEGGVWLVCTLLPREPVAFVISVRVAVAAAGLTGADVVDEAGLLGRRVIPPAQALEIMRQVERGDETSPEGRADRIFQMLVRQSSAGHE